VSTLLGERIGRARMTASSVADTLGRRRKHECR
jgi:hypothetical protein